VIVAAGPDHDLHLLGSGTEEVFELSGALFDLQTPAQMQLISTCGY
jgi:hypothetical protein